MASPSLFRRPPARSAGLPSDHPARRPRACDTAGEHDVAPGMPVPAIWFSDGRPPSAASFRAPAVGRRDGGGKGHRPGMTEAVHGLRSEGQLAGGSGAGKVQFPAASTGTSSVCVPTVMRTLEFGATSEAGAAATWPVMGSPAATVRIRGRHEFGLVQEELELHAAGDLGHGVFKRRGDGTNLLAPHALGAGVGADSEVSADPGAAGVSPARGDRCRVEGMNRTEVIVIVRGQRFRARDYPDAHRVDGAALPAACPPGPADVLALKWRDGSDDLHCGRGRIARVIPLRGGRLDAEIRPQGLEDGNIRADIWSLSRWP